LAEIRPFRGIRYSKELSARLSDLVAPPYDVLDESGKATLQRKHDRNIVAVDLPHMPPKTVGPDSAYQTADRTLRQWITEGVLSRDDQPAFYAYAQTYSHGRKKYNRRGFFSLVKLSPFGAGQVVPHEKTYPDAIADRLKLTQATRMQLSPIFGLFSDPANEVTSELFKGAGEAQQTATLDGVKNELWPVTDPAIQAKVAQLISPRPIYIADGHHRYTMALQYEKDNPTANYALFVLVAMQDPGLLILPTHRIIGGMNRFDPAAMRARLGANAELTELAISPDGVDEYADQIMPLKPPHTFGLYDGANQTLYELKLKNPDVLKSLEPNQSDSWRQLDVAILQRYLLDEVIAPTFAPGREITKGYTADPKAIVTMTDGERRQIALLLQPTPLKALEELGRHNEVMPQKSTYFFPKLATGMVMNPLE